MFPNIHRCCGLHEHVEVHYHVDEYEARLHRDADDSVAASGRGPDVESALRDLDAQLIGVTLDHIRGRRP